MRIVGTDEQDRIFGGEFCFVLCVINSTKVGMIFIASHLLLDIGGTNK